MNDEADGAVADSHPQAGDAFLPFPVVLCWWRCSLWFVGSVGVSAADSGTVHWRDRFRIVGHHAPHLRSCRHLLPIARGTAFSHPDREGDAYVHHPNGNSILG